MTLDRLGPVMLDITGVELIPEEREIIAHPKVGGVILFTRNFEDSKQLFDLVRTLREVREDIVIAVDHEGGRVQRFRQGFTRVPAMQSIARCFGDTSQEARRCAEELGWIMSAELIAHGIDMSFAPVLDVDDCLSDIIGDRAFSAQPEAVVTLASAFIDGMHGAGMAVTGKHFPGHGGVKADSHVELPIDTRDLSMLQQRDLIPFIELIDKLDAIMSAHIVFPEIDATAVTFSEQWLRVYLREDLGFSGLIFSDDLSMAGAKDVGSYPERARRALDAGCDIVLVCNEPAQAIAVLEDLESDRRYVVPSGLGKMSRRQTYDSSALQRSQRWQRANAMAQKLCSA